VSIADWDGMLGETITVANPSSTGGASLFGTPAMSTGVLTFKARIVEVHGSNRRLTNIDEHVSHVLWCDNTSTSAITRTSVITFPSGVHPPVKQVEYPRDENGNVHHTKVLFG